MTRALKRVSSRRKALALLGGAIVLCSAVVLPLLQVTSETPWSPIWIVAPLVISTAGFIAVVVVPWLAATPLRRLYRDKLKAQPDAIVSIVEVSLREAPTEALSVLVAGEERVSLVGLEVSELIFHWGEIESVAMAGLSIETIKMTTSGPLGDVRLTLLKSNGIQPLPGWQLANRLAQLQRLHQRSKDVA